MLYENDIRSNKGEFTMKFIFEDFEDDILSRFFRQAYQPESSKKFIYADGNGNLEFQVKKFWKNQKK